MHAPYRDVSAAEKVYFPRDGALFHQYSACRCKLVGGTAKDAAAHLHANAKGRNNRQEFTGNENGMRRQVIGEMAKERRRDHALYGMRTT